eukprot:NODE_737_length_4687_cov_0.414778.p4 type:complete len:155 gc:universal NODE_737_length_4687_cov_0.414778:3322-3786(+)
MGKHSKSRKLTRQTRKLKDAHLKQPLPSDNVLKSKWDKVYPSDYKEQLKSFGLKIDINNIKNASVVDAITCIDPIKTKTTEFLDQISSLESKNSYFYLSENECVTLASLVKKYGEDIKKMSRDIDINVMQWTESQITRKINKLRLEVFASEKAK